MNSAKVLLIAVSLLLIPISAVCEPNGWTGNFSGYLGYKDLDKDDWKPVDSHGEIGFLLDFRPKNWPVNIAFDYLDSDEYELTTISGSLARIDGDTSEIAIGIRKIFEPFATLRPYIGAGVAYIHGEFEINRIPGTTSDDDAEIGLWLDAGLYWSLYEHLQIGVDLRYSEAEIKIFGAEIEAGGFHAGLTFGFRW
jgi:opacity protein-like surface antigen